MNTKLRGPKPQVKRNSTEVTKKQSTSGEHCGSFINRKVDRFFSLYRGVLHTSHLTWWNRVNLSDRQDARLTEVRTHLTDIQVERRCTTAQDTLKDPCPF